MILRATLLAGLGLFALPASAQSVHDTGTIQAEVFADGTIGQNLGVGTGFIFDGANGLFEGQLMVATSENQVSGQAYFDSADTPPTDWVQISTPAALTPPFDAPFDVFDQGFEATFDDSAAPTPLGITVRQRTYSSSAEPNNDFLVVEYQITNNTAEQIQDAYIGFFADWDVNAATANTGTYDGDDGTLYVFDTQAAGSIFGTSVLGADVSGYTLEVGAGTNPVDGQMYIGMTTEAGDPINPDDLRTVIGQGPYFIQPDDTATVYFALLAGTNIPDAQANSAAANALMLQFVSDEASPESVTDVLSVPSPNPSSSTARVTLSLDAAETVQVTVADVLGRTVATLHNGVLAAGSTALTVDAGSMAPGVYVVRAQGETFRQTRTLTVAR